MGVLFIRICFTGVLLRISFTGVLLIIICFMGVLLISLFYGCVTQN